MSTTGVTNNYKVGRGAVYFDRFATGTQNLTGEQFLGDVMGLNFTSKATQLDHYQSTGGVKIIDQSATVQTDWSGTLTTENISSSNLALFWFGTASQVTIASATVSAESVGPVLPGMFYQLGKGADPVGVRDLDSTTPVTAQNGATNYAIGTDFTVDYLRGRIYIVPGSTLATAAAAGAVTLSVTYKTKASTRNRVISGQTPIEGALRFLSANTVGADNDVYVPWCKLTPNGNYELIGDKFVQLQLDLKILKLASAAGSVYFDDVPN